MCGSNGVTYSNQCELEKAKCELMQDISLEHTGACEQMTDIIWYDVGLLDRFVFLATNNQIINMACTALVYTQ